MSAIRNSWPRIRTIGLPMTAWLRCKRSDTSPQIHMALFAFIFIFQFGCSEQLRSDAEKQSNEEKPAPVANLSADWKKYSGYWSFTDVWVPWMGAALEVKDGKFKFWFKSDVGELHPTKYPIEGKAEVINGILNLVTDKSVYSKKWYLVVGYGQEFGIFPLDNLGTILVRDEKPTERMMALVSKDIEPKD